MTAEIIDIIQVSLICFFAFFGVCMPYPIFIYSFIVLNNGKWKNAHKNYVNYLYIATLLCCAATAKLNISYMIFAIFPTLMSISAILIMKKLSTIKANGLILWSFICIIGYGIITTMFFALFALPDDYFDIGFPFIMTIFFIFGLNVSIMMLYNAYKFLLLICERAKQ